MTDLTVRPPVWHWRANLKTLDCFTVRYFFLMLHVLLFETSPGWLLWWIFLHSDPLYLLIAALYWCLGRRGFSVSNVALVKTALCCENGRFGGVIPCIDPMCMKYANEMCNNHQFSYEPLANKCHRWQYLEIYFLCSASIYFDIWFENSLSSNFP